MTVHGRDYTLDVACPVCGAKIGVPCDSAGRGSSPSHIARQLARDEKHDRALMTYGHETTTRHAPLVGAGAALDHLTGGAALYARQQTALEAANTTCRLSERHYIQRAALRNGIAAYLRSMREGEVA